MFSAPPVTINPVVSTTLRFDVALNSTVGTFSLTPALCANLDGLNYLNVSAPRYNFIKISAVRCWVENPVVLNVAAQDTSIIFQDLISGVNILAHAITGIQPASINYTFDLPPLYATSSTTDICSVGIVDTISSTTWTLILDVDCQLH
jgi:hypothetical protein